MKPDTVQNMTSQAIGVVHVCELGQRVSAVPVQAGLQRQNGRCDSLYKDRINRGFEVSMSVRQQKQDYTLRIIILFDHNLGRIERKGLESRITKTREAL